MGISESTSEFVKREWQEISRVMTLVEGKGWANGLPEPAFQTREAHADVPPMALFRFGDRLIYSRLATGHVVEMRFEGDEMRSRVFDARGKPVTSPTVATGDPSLN